MKLSTFLQNKSNVKIPLEIMKIPVVKIHKKKLMNRVRYRSCYILNIYANLAYMYILKVHGLKYFQLSETGSSKYIRLNDYAKAVNTYTRQTV